MGTQKKNRAAQRAGSALPALGHDEVGLYVSRAWDGELSAEEAKALACHLRACQECADSAKRLLDFLARLDPHL